MSDRPTLLPPNELMIRLYHTPLGAMLGRMILLLTTRGRHTGHPHVTPLQYESVGSDLHLGAARGVNADWVRNILAHPQVEVRVGRRAFAALARVVTESGPIADFLELRLRRHPHIVGAILRFEGLPRTPSRTDLKVYAARLALVILTPQPGGEAG